MHSVAWRPHYWIHVIIDTLMTVGKDSIWAGKTLRSGSQTAGDPSRGIAMQMSLFQGGAVHVQEGCDAREWRAGEVCCDRALVRTEYLRGALVAGAAGARLLALTGAALRDVLGCALADYKSPSSSRRRASRACHQPHVQLLPAASLPTCKHQRMS